VRDAFGQAAMDPKSAVSALLALCQKRIDMPTSYMTSGYQGDSWSFSASACALAWQLTGDAKYAAQGIKLWRALLEDVAMLGDKKACVPGAAMTAAIASVGATPGTPSASRAAHGRSSTLAASTPRASTRLRQQTRDCFPDLELHDERLPARSTGRQLPRLARGGEDAHPIAEARGGADSDTF
jgi:hypothetical protein